MAAKKFRHRTTARNRADPLIDLCRLHQRVDALVGPVLNQQSRSEVFERIGEQEGPGRLPENLHRVGKQLGIVGQ